MPVLRHTGRIVRRKTTNENHKRWLVCRIEMTTLRYASRVIQLILFGFDPHVDNGVGMKEGMSV